MVLAAGAGRRLRPAADGLRDVVVVVGYAADAVRDRAAAMEREYGVRLRLVDNDRAEEWNNAYSLWLARDLFAEGALLVNGDTVHPVSVEKTLLSARGPGVLLAVDAVKTLGDEEMKVVVDPDGQVRRITKLMDATSA